MQEVKKKAQSQPQLYNKFEATLSYTIEHNKTQQIHSCFPLEYIKVEFNELISYLRAGDVAQCLISVHEALGSVPSPCNNWVWSPCLQSQRWESGGRKIRNEKIVLSYILSPRLGL